MASACAFASDHLIVLKGVAASEFRAPDFLRVWVHDGDASLDALVELVHSKDPLGLSISW